MNRFEWYGKKVSKKTEIATRVAMDKTMAACIAEAKKLVPVKTGLLQGSIRMKPTANLGGRLIGYWGSFNVKYAIYVELGTKPHIIRPKNKKALYWPGAAHPVMVVHHPGTEKRPYLRPAADREYPLLRRRIKTIRRGMR